MEGIVFKQIKTLNSRRMILLFSNEKGKISAGTSVSEKGKSKSALAMRPFTYSRFDISENKGYFNISNAETIKSYYKIGDDLDKFANASYILEITEKMLPDEVPAPKLLSLLLSYLEILEQRNKSYKTLTLAYIVKALQIGGVAPQVKKCLHCGGENAPVFFDVKNAGFVCEKCGGTSYNNGTQTLLYRVNFDIVKVLNFFMESSLEKIKKLELNPEAAKELSKIIKEYTAYHLDIGNTKSEALLDMNL